MNTRNIRFRSNRVRDILALFHEELDGLYGHGEVAAFGEMLFEAFLGWDRVRLLISREATIDQSDLLRFHWALEDLKCHRPVQHIIGYADFCGCRIGVGLDVLVPRPETEEMVAAIIGQMRGEYTSFVRTDGPDGMPRTLRILDLCTGSGCIAIALKRAFPEADVTAVDVSEKALLVARKNAADNNAEVDFVQADILAPQSSLFTSRYSLIVGNPPYVRDSERVQMQRNVLDYDPVLALFVPDDDPLCFYRAIGALAQRCLAADGLLAVEINEALADETCGVLAAHGFSTTCHRDFRGRWRWVEARRARAGANPS